MSNKALKECDSLREAVKEIKNKLSLIDKEAQELWKLMKKHDSENTKETMQEHSFHDKLCLVYRNDYYDETYYIFENVYDIEDWLNGKWSEWNLWDYDDPNAFFEETLVVWEFHRDVCKERWPYLYKNSKHFVEGWSRKRMTANVKPVPSFSIS